MQDKHTPDQDRSLLVQEHRQEVTIIVNATPHAVSVGVITFAALVALAYPTAPGPDPEYSVTYRNGAKHATGTLCEGETVALREGMIFVVTATDKS